MNLTWLQHFKPYTCHERMKTALKTTRCVAVLREKKSLEVQAKNVSTVKRVPGITSHQCLQLGRAQQRLNWPFPYFST